jgi:alkyl hydroperoxide reductase subunit AhpC
MSTDTAIQESLMMEEDLFPPEGMLRVGDRFPQFSLTAVVSSKREEAFKVVSTEDYTNKWLVVFAWPKDFTFVCPTEIAEFNRLYDDFQDRDAQVLGLSIDSENVHLAWRQSHADLQALKLPMLSDIKRVLSWQCGILDPKTGVAQRATFIVDPESTVQFSMMTPMKVGRNPTEVLRILDGLQTEGLCACGWQPGDENI